MNSLLSGKKFFLSMVFLSSLVFLVGCGDRQNTVVSIAIHPKKPKILYVATNEAVYKTRDEGQSWQRLNSDLRRVRVNVLVVDPHLPANVFAGTSADGVYKSPDGGRRWMAKNEGIQKGTISVNVQDLVFHPGSSHVLYAATTVGVFRSTDGGEHWNERMKGMTEINFVVTLAVDPVRPTIMYAGTSGGVYRSVDSTGSWRKINTGLVPSDAKMASMAIGVNALVVDPLEPDTVYAGTTKGIFKTRNQGDSWEPIGEEVRGRYVSALALDPHHHETIYAGLSDGLQKSENGGKTWVPINKGLGNVNIRSIAINQENSQIVYIGTNGGGAYRSNNGGESWAQLTLHDAQ